MPNRRSLCLLLLAAVPLAGCASVSQDVTSAKQSITSAKQDISKELSKVSHRYGGSVGHAGGGQVSNSSVSGSRSFGQAPAGPTHGGALPVSNASAASVQAQPPAGSCRAVGQGVFVEPDPRCTPGALNPAVTQATIGQTICATGWTKTVRPSSGVTSAEKRASMTAYGDTGSAHGFEYDHLISLELGGAVNAAQNLWPEPGGVPNPKDKVENGLRKLVCAGQMSLAQAQRLISEQWVSYYHAHY